LKAFRNWVTKSGKNLRLFNRDIVVAIGSYSFHADGIGALAVQPYQGKAHFM
jgi:hypothetical protein